MRKSDSIDGYVLSGDKAFDFLRSIYFLEKPAVLNQETADSSAQISKDTPAGEKRKRESKLSLFILDLTVFVEEEQMAAAEEAKKQKLSKKID